MTYFEYMDKVSNQFIIKDERSGMYYLDPAYMYAVNSENYCKDNPDIIMAELNRYLDLEVNRLNASNDHSKIVVDWIYNVLTTEVDETLLNEENDLVKNVLNYMQYNDKLKDKEKLLEMKDEAIKKKQKFKGFSFTKKEA